MALTITAAAPPRQIEPPPIEPDMTYRPTTEAELKQADSEYKSATPVQHRAFQRWCLEQPHGAAPFNDHSWLAWRKATAAAAATH